MKEKSEIAKLWAEAYTEEKRLGSIAAAARDDYESQKMMRGKIEKDLDNVGNNIRRRIYETEHGLVLIEWHNDRADEKPYITVKLEQTE